MNVKFLFFERERHREKETEIEPFLHGSTLSVPRKAEANGERPAAYISL